MQIDWSSVFLPSLGIAEIVVRGTLMYLGLFVIYVLLRGAKLVILGRPTCW